MKSLHLLLGLVPVCLFVFCCSLNQSKAATIAFYDFSIDDNPNIEATHTSSSAMTGDGWTSGGSASFGRSSFSSNYFGRGPSTTVGTSYVSFSISADPGYALNLDQLDYDYYFSQSEGVTSDQVTFEVRSSVDGFSSTIPGTYSLNPAGTTPFLQNATLNLTGGTYDGLSSIEFRFYATNNTEAIFNDIVRWDNITVTGDAAVIPEPTAVSLLLGAFGLLAFQRRRG